MTREEAIKTITQSDLFWCRPTEDESVALNMAIDALQEKTCGKWIIKRGNYCGVELKEFYCDKCGTRGALRRVFSDPEPLPNFCGNCGADMRVKNDDERSE